MATIATLIVKLGADIADLKAGVDAAGNKIDSFASKATTAFRALTGAAAFGAVAGMVSTVAGAIDEIDGISATINDTAENVQRLQAVSESFDVEMTAIVGAIQEMERGLSNGKIEGALEAINIEVADFQSMAPSQRYVEVAEALAQVEDRSLQVELAQQIFGKAWKQNIAAIREGVSEADRWIKISDETVETMDRLGISWANIKASTVNFTAALLDNVLQLSTLVSMYDNARDSINRLYMTDKNYNAWKAGQNAKDLAGLLPASPVKGPPSAPGLPKDYDEINKSLTEIVEKSIKVHTAQAKIAEAAKRARESFEEGVRALTDKIRLSEYFARIEGTDIRQAMADTNKKLSTQLNYLEDINHEVDTLRFGSTDLAATFPFLTSEWGQLKQGVEDTKPAMAALAIEAERVAQRLLTWRGVGQQLSGAILSALQGGGDVGKALGGSAGQMLGTKLGDTIGNWAGKAIGGSLGAAIGGAAGSVLPVVGTMLGSLAGSFIGKMFGGNDAQNARSAEKMQVFAQFTSEQFLSLQREAEKFGLTMDRALSASTMAEFNAAIEETNGKLRELNGLQSEIDRLTSATTVGFDQMSAIAKEFGLDISKLGPAFQQAAIDKEAQRVIDAFAVMEKGGADMGGVLDGMKDEIGKLVQDSLKFGTTLPENMKPWIDELFKTGRLIDGNGKKIDDISKLKFGAPMESEMSKLTRELEKIVTKLDEMTSALRNAIPSALRDLPKDTRIGVKLDVDSSSLDDYSIEGRFPKLAAGGIVTQPTVAMIGEAGPEAVVPLSRLGNGIRGGGGETHVHIHGGVFDGYTSEVSFARRVLDVLSQETERRGRGLAFGAA